MLYDGLHQKQLTLADSVEVYPAHGAGALWPQHQLRAALYHR
jgi:hypothetical protein